MLACKTLVLDFRLTIMDVTLVVAMQISWYSYSGISSSPLSDFLFAVYILCFLWRAFSFESTAF